MGGKKKKTYPKTLFEKFAWGTTPGCHVAHVVDIEDEESKNYYAIFGQNFDFSSETYKTLNKFKNAKFLEDRDYKTVNHHDTFVNKGDNNTAEFFMNLAKMCKYKYKENTPEPYKDFLLSIKDYITASGRENQQKAIRNLYQTGYTALDNADLDAQSKNEIAKVISHIIKRTNGNLKVPEDYAKSQKSREKIEEPSNTKTGAFGMWTKSQDVLFPHEPSPNDIKQGVGVEDCYVLAALSQMASTNPQFIKDSMVDNNDGTVTVRFFNKTMVNGEEIAEPEYYTVNKTVNKLAGSANLYASSSLWVQMMEKAYVAYIDKHPESREVYEKPNSYKNIDRGYSSDFLNAFVPDKSFGGFAAVFGYGFVGNGDLYKFNEDGTPKFDPPEYIDRENLLYDTFSKALDNNDIVTVQSSGAALEKVGITTQNAKETEKYVKDRGIRTGHVYSVLGVFEKDGKKYVQLRDPYATFSPKYNEKNELVNDSKVIESTLKAGAGSLGTFNLELRDFFRTFDSIQSMNSEYYAEYDEALYKLPRYEGLKPQERKQPQRSESQQASETQTEKQTEKQTEQPLKEHSEKEIKSNEIKKPVSGEPATLAEALKTKGGYANVKTSIAYLSADLQSTSMFFSFKNSDEFVKMRDKLTEINKNLGTKESCTDQEAVDLAKDITDLSKLAEKYVDVKKAKLDGVDKKPSLRAVHRFVSAVNLIRLVDNPEAPIAQPEHGFAECMTIVQADINNAKERLTNSPEKASLKSRLDAASASIEKFLRDNPDIANQQRSVAKADPENKFVRDAKPKETSEVVTEKTEQALQL